MKNNYIKIRWMRRTVIVIALPIGIIVFSIAFIIKSLASGILAGCAEFIEGMKENFCGFDKFMQAMIEMWNNK